jgi:hypothetical protein
MRQRMWKWVGVGAMALLVAGGARLEAQTWKKAVAAAMVLAVLGGGQAHPGGAPVPAPIGADGLRPFPGPAAGVLVPDLGLAGTDLRDSDAAATQGTCAQACETQATLALIRCETYLQMQALRNLCITRMLTAEEQCGLACLRR